MERQSPSLWVCRVFAVARAGYVSLDDGHPWGALAAALPHLLLLLGVLPVLSATGWVKAAGLFWLVLDLTSDVLALTGAEAGTFLTVRFVGHLGAAVWIPARRGRAAARFA